MERRYSQTFLIGSVLLTASLTAAWSGRDPATEPAPTEPAPMEAITRSSAPAEVGAVVWDLPVTRNESVEWWIDFLEDRNSEHTRLWLEREGRYGPMIRAELRRRGMPEDLVYLAMIESGFSPKAYSRAAASGLWQFIAETGQRYGLEVSDEVDERRDPIKATAAALDYLEDLHDRFGSWYLAAASYNTGENRVGRIMREEFGTERGTDDHFWMIAHRLPRETRDYVPLMLAAGHIGKEPHAYGFDGLELQEPLAWDVVWVPGATAFATIADAAGVDVEAVAELNTHLTKNRTPANRGWSVRLPVGTRVAFEAAFPELYRTARLTEEEEEAPVKAVASLTHRVRAGETLSHVAQRYGVSVAVLRSANGNIDPRRVRAGQSLTVPGGSETAVRDRFHSVNRGENLTVIARRYGVSVAQLRSWNGMSGSRIRPGQRLRIGT